MTGSTWASESDGPLTASSLTSWVEGADARTSVVFERVSAFAVWSRCRLNISQVLVDNTPERTSLPAEVCVKSAFLSTLDGGIRCYGACRQVAICCQCVL